MTSVVDRTRALLPQLCSPASSVGQAVPSCYSREHAVSFILPIILH